MRGREETSANHLHIGGYSTVNKMYRHCKGVESKPFRGGGHRSKLTYYPNGDADSKTGCPGVLLCLMENRYRFLGRAADATAGHSVSVLDRDGNLMYSRCVEPQNYSLHDSSCGSSGIWIDVMDATTAEETKEALRRLKDDRSTGDLRCKRRADGCGSAREEQMRGPIGISIYLIITAWVLLINYKIVQPIIIQL